MNDRFRFRAWDSEKLIMHYDICSLLIIAKLEDVANYKYFTLMQCTGLKDINGKLIYEGDICEYKYYDYEKKYKCTIIWSDEKGRWDCKEIQNDTVIFDSLYDMMDWMVSSFKVIGNIYENPELLKEEVL